MTSLDRYGSIAPIYDLLPTDRPLYRRPRLAGLRMLRVLRGATVLDLGCGTGVNLPLLLNAVGPDGFVLGLEVDPRMLAVARHRVAGVPASRVALVEADATTVTPEVVASASRSAGRNGLVQALFASYTLSVVPDPAAAWRRSTALLAPGARVAIVDVQPPQGRAAVLAPLAAVLPVVFGGADLTARPWTALEEAGAEVEQRAFLGGHVVATAGTLP